jgi:predicted molibdopterin-dependent oxidoreductase YjgC
MVIQALATKAFGGPADQAIGPVVRAVKGALEARFGTWRMAANLERLPKAKAIVTVADDIEESHNVVSVRIKDAVVWEKAKLVVIGPLRSELVDFATVWIRTAAGEEGLAAQQLAEALAGGSPANDEIAQAAAILREAPREGTMVVCAPNPVSPAVAAAMTGGAANLAIALFGEAASEHLAVLPPEANTWGLLDQGIGAEGAGDPLDGLAGLLVIRDDPTMRLPGAAEALERIGTVVVVDGVAHATARRASAVIAEGRAYASQGTYTSADFRAQRLAPAVRPEGDAVPLWEALHVLAKELGVEVPATPDDALAAIAKANALYEPAWDLIIGEGVKLNVPRSSRAQGVPVEPPVAGEGWRIITSRDLYTALDAAALRHPEAEKLHRYDRIQVSEEDARALGITTGDPVRVSGNGQVIEAAAWVTERVPQGHVYISSLLQGGAVTGLFGGQGVATVRLEARVPAAAG